MSSFTVKNKNLKKRRIKITLCVLIPTLVACTAVAVAVPITQCSNNLTFTKTATLAYYQSLFNDLQTERVSKKFSGIKGDYSDITSYQAAIKLQSQWSAKFVFYATIVTIWSGINNLWMILTGREMMTSEAQEVKTTHKIVIAKNGGEITQFDLTGYGGNENFDFKFRYYCVMPTDLWAASKVKNDTSRWSNIAIYSSGEDDAPPPPQYQIDGVYNDYPFSDTSSNIIISFVWLCKMTPNLDLPYKFSTT